jgi:1-aminocyclopropane-1-carboxylate synthase
MAPSQERSVLILSCFLFASTAYWKWRKINEERKKKERGGRAAPLSIGYVHGSNVANRCMRALAPATPYLEAFLSGLQYPCDPTSRPDGFIAFCMAENKLVIDVLAERLMQAGTATAAFSDSTVYCYNSFLGIPVARQAAAYFIAKRFMFTETPSITLDQALASINPDHIGIGPGAVGLLNSLFYLLGEEGEACLIPAPYYAAFENDMAVS